MTIYPAIDIKGGRCVRLVQGRADRETVYSENPAEVAGVFNECGSKWIHVVDLDGAFEGRPRNLAAVEAIVDLGLAVQLGGGLRTREDVEAAIGIGVRRIVIGTRAVENDSFVGELVGEFGDKVAVGIDARNGIVAVKGWVTTANLDAASLATRMRDLGVRTIIHTDIGTDGMLTGPNFAAQETLLAIGGFNVIASGGVSRREDVVKLAELARSHSNFDGVIVGKALYEKRVDLPDLLMLARS